MSRRSYPMVVTYPEPFIGDLDHPYGEQEVGDE